MSVDINVVDEVTPVLGQPSEICNSATAIELTNYVDANYPDGTWSGDGVTGTSFDPSGVSVGIHSLTFTSTAPCTKPVSVDINVVDEIEPTLGQPDDICAASSPIILMNYIDVNYPNGIWSGDGVINDNEFDPTGLSLGPHIVTFTSSDPCTKPIGMAINIVEEQTPTLGMPDAQCQSANPLDLMDYVDPLFPDGEWSGKGVNNNKFYSENLPEGSYDVAFTPEADCTTGASMRIDVVASSTSTHEETLCTGESITLFGITFDESHPSEDIVLAEKNAAGCDSIVSVNISFTSKPSAILSGEATICSGNTAEISVEFSDGGTHDITISDGQNNIVYNDIESGVPFEVIVNATTTFSLESVDSGVNCPFDLSGKAIISIDDIQSEINVVSDYNGFGVSCEGVEDGEIMATANGTGQSPYNYFWSTGESTPTINNIGEGLYHVTITDALGCTSEETIDMKAPQKLQSDLVVDQPNCEIQTGSIEIGVPNIENGPFIVQIGNQNVVLNDDKIVINDLFPGTYELSIEDQNGCIVYEEIVIDTIQLPYFNLGDDVSILQGESIDLSTYIDFESSEIVWTPADYLSCDDCLNPVATPPVSTAYQLRITDANGCTYLDAITIVVRIEDRIYVPNGFTPNFDSTNDIFKVFTDRDDVVIQEMSIFDRWGDMVYTVKDAKPNDPAAGWDGQINGKDANQGVYGYYILIKFPDGKVKLFEGDLTLIR